MKWTLKKVKPFEHPSRPPRMDPNWKACEYYFVHDGGTDLSNQKSVNEDMVREGSDLNSGIAVLGLEAGENPGKKARVSNQDRHRTALGRVTAMNNKLGRAIGQAEGSLPGLRRTLSPNVYIVFRNGLQQCREAKEDMMDRVEDLKTLADSPEKQEEQIEALKALLLESSECLDALVESRKQHEPAPPPTPPIKNEAVRPERGDGHGDEGQPNSEWPASEEQLSLIDGTQPQDEP